MPKIISSRIRQPKHFYWKVDLRKDQIVQPGVHYYWDPWGTLRADETYIVTRLSARLISGDRNALRPAASELLVRLMVQGDVKWSRDLEHVVVTPLDEELETRIHRMELVLNWLMNEETKASKTLQRLGAQPLKDIPVTLAPGRLGKPFGVQPRQSMNASIVSDRKVAIPCDATINFELHAIHSYDHFT